MSIFLEVNKVKLARYWRFRAILSILLLISCISTGVLIARLKSLSNSGVLPHQLYDNYRDLTDMRAVLKTQGTVERLEEISRERDNLGIRQERTVEKRFQEIDSYTSYFQDNHIFQEEEIHKIRIQMSFTESQIERKEQQLEEAKENQKKSIEDEIKLLQQELRLRKEFLDNFIEQRSADEQILSILNNVRNLEKRVMSRKDDESFAMSSDIFNSRNSLFEYRLQAQVEIHRSIQSSLDSEISSSKERKDDFTDTIDEVESVLSTLGKIETLEELQFFEDFPRVSNSAYSKEQWELRLNKFRFYLEHEKERFSVLNKIHENLHSQESDLDHSGISWRSDDIAIFEELGKNFQGILDAKYRYTSSIFSLRDETLPHILLENFTEESRIYFRNLESSLVRKDTLERDISSLNLLINRLHDLQYQTSHEGLIFSLNARIIVVIVVRNRLESELNQINNDVVEYAADLDTYLLYVTHVVREMLLHKRNKYINADQPHESLLIVDSHLKEFRINLISTVFLVSVCFALLVAAVQVKNPTVIKDIRQLVIIFEEDWVRVLLDLEEKLEAAKRSKLIISIYLLLAATDMLIAKMAIMIDNLWLPQNDSQIDD